MQIALNAAMKRKPSRQETRRATGSKPIVDEHDHAGATHPEQESSSQRARAGSKSPRQRTGRSDA